MAVPASGTLYLSKIANEKHFDNYNQAQMPTPPYSLKDITIGGNSLKTGGVSYETTNTNSDSRPNNTTPYGMSEFYGYDHDATAAKYLKHIGNQMESFTTNALGTSNSQMSGTSHSVSAFNEYQHTYVQVEMLDQEFDQLRFNIEISSDFVLAGLWRGGEDQRGQFPESPNAKDGWQFIQSFDGGSHSVSIGGSPGTIMYITMYGFSKSSGNFTIENMYCEPKSS